MYAVIESGGKQYRVAIGDRLKVESLKLDPGSKLNLEKVLMLSDTGGIRTGDPYLGSTVEATVVGHGRGEKIRIFKLRRRQNSRNQAGHRQNFTELEIVSIDGKSAQPAAKPVKAKPGKQATPDGGDAEGAETEKKAATRKAATKKKASKKTAEKAADEATQTAEQETAAKNSTDEQS